MHGHAPQHNTTIPMLNNDESTSHTLSKYSRLLPQYNPARSYTSMASTGQTTSRNVCRDSSYSCSGTVTTRQEIARLSGAWVQRTGFLQSGFLWFFNTPEILWIGNNMVFYGLFIRAQLLHVWFHSLQDAQLTRTRRSWSISRPIMQRLLIWSGRASQMMIRIRIPHFRLIQIEFFTLNAETSLQIKRQIVIMVLLWFLWCFEKPENLQKYNPVFCTPGPA
jgi:hypothetical protein